MSNSKEHQCRPQDHDYYNGICIACGKSSPIPIIIAVDFDGTCVTHEYPKVGRNIGAGEVLRDIAVYGHNIILWTMRSGEYLEDAVEWFDSQDIALFGVNQNPEQLTWTDSPKAYAHLYIDDAALGIPLCEGLEGKRPYVDWVKTRKSLEERKII